MAVRIRMTLLTATLAAKVGIVPWRPILEVPKAAVLSVARGRALRGPVCACACVCASTCSPRRSRSHAGAGKEGKEEKEGGGSRGQTRAQVPVGTIPLSPGLPRHIAPPRAAKDYAGGGALCGRSAPVHPLHARESGTPPSHSGSAATIVCGGGGFRQERLQSGCWDATSG